MSIAAHPGLSERESDNLITAYIRLLYERAWRRLQQHHDDWRNADVCVPGSRTGTITGGLREWAYETSHTGSDDDTAREILAHAVPYMAPVLADCRGPGAILDGFVTHDTDAGRIPQLKLPYVLMNSPAVATAEDALGPDTAAMLLLDALCESASAGGYLHHWAHQVGRLLDIVSGVMGSRRADTPTKLSDWVDSSENAVHAYRSRTMSSITSGGGPADCSNEARRATDLTPETGSAASAPRRIGNGQMYFFDGGRWTTDHIGARYADDLSRAVRRISFIHEAAADGADNSYLQEHISYMDNACSAVRQSAEQQRRALAAMADAWQHAQHRILSAKHS